MDPQNSPPVDLVEAATMAYNLEMQLQEGHEEALRVAIVAVLESHRQQVLSEVSETLSGYTRDLYDDEYVSNETADYVGYTTVIIKALGAPEQEHGKYEPHNEDLIDIIARGKVYKDSGSRIWKVILDRGDIIDFDLAREETNVRVRLIEREAE